MALTVRLSPKIERTLNALAKRRRLSRSDIVRDALAQYELAERAHAPRDRAYDAWLDVIGVINLGVRDPRRTTGEQFTDLVGKRPHARRTR
jgi:metal-responsive CopG/Arc/MetJ family transcriptional regulator